MNATTEMTALEARDRLDAIADYLDTLLRSLWEDLDTVGLTTMDRGATKGTAAEDALRTVSLAQELVKELDSLGPALSNVETA